MTAADQLLDEVWSRQAIADQCHRYCRALDRVDEALLRSVFHPDSTHRHDAFKGSSAAFCGYAIAVVRSLERTQHHLGNVLIDMEGDVAHSESYFLAFHRIALGVAGKGLFERHDMAVDEDVFVGGRYLDRFERREGVWRIAHRTGVHDWERWGRSDERYFGDMSASATGKRSLDDPLYSNR